MKKQNLSTTKIKREIDPIPRRYCLLTIVFGVIIVSGFLFAARQHFMAINLGIENSELRKKRDELSTEQRRLRIAREIAYSPIELEKTAARIGLQRVSFSVPIAPKVEIESNPDFSKIEIKKTEKIVQKNEVKDTNPFDNINAEGKKESKSNEKTKEITGKDGSKKVVEAKKDSKSEKRIESAAKIMSEKDSKNSKL